jgi:hypothetical protein
MRVPTCKKKRRPRAWCSIASIAAVVDELHDVDRGRRARSSAGAGMPLDELRAPGARPAADEITAALSDRTRERDAGARGRLVRASIGPPYPTGRRLEPCLIST